MTTLSIADRDPKSPLDIPDYRRFWLARLLSGFATSGMVVILGYQLYDVARSDYAMSIPQAAFQLGLFGLAQFVPLFLLTPLAGLVADRFDRRTVTGLAITLNLLIALILASATQLKLLSLPLIFTIGVLHGTARVFIGPALASIMPNIVPQQLLARAVAFSAFGVQIGRLSGPAIAGVLFAFERSLPYWLAAAQLAASAICVFWIRAVPPPPENRDTHPLHQIMEGLAYAWKDRFLLGCISLDLFAVLLGGATALLPVFARDVLTWNGAPVGSYGLGLMRAMPGLGAALMAGILSRRPIGMDVGVKMLASVAVYGAATAAFGLSRNFMLSLALLCLLGAADMVSMYIRSTLVQLHTPDSVRGRVSAISGLAISASNELGELQSGIAAALLGATGAVVFGGVGAMMVTALWAKLFPEIRKAKTFASED